MHDCPAARENAVEHVGAAANDSPAADLAGCADCEAWYYESAAAIKLLAGALDAAQPQEAYWEAYESRLFARIAGESRKRVVRRFLWGVAAAAAVGLVATVLGIREQPARVPSAIIAPQPASGSPAAAMRPPERVNGRFSTGSAGGQPSLALTLELGRHLESVRLLLLSVKNGADDIELDRRRARQLLDRQHVLRRAASDASDVAAGSILDRVEPYLLDIKHVTGEPEDTRRLQSRLRDNPILTLVNVYETNP